jgi:hypothetical protein
MSERQGGPAGDQPRPGLSADPTSDGEFDVAQSRRILVELQQKLESMPAIEQAKGILMARFSLDAPRAFNLLVRWSQVNNVKLRAVSDLLVGAADDPAALDRTIEGLQQHTPRGAAQRRSQREGRS